MYFSEIQINKDVWEKPGNPDVLGVKNILLQCADVSHVRIFRIPL